MATRSEHVHPAPPVKATQSDDVDPANQAEPPRQPQAEINGPSGLGVAFWVYWVLGSFGWSMAARFASDDAIPRVALFAFLYLVWAGSMVWRAATRSRSGWGVAARFLVVIGLILNGLVTAAILRVASQA